MTLTATTRRPAHLAVVEVVLDADGTFMWEAEVGRYRARSSARDRVAASQRREQERRRHSSTRAHFEIRVIPVEER